MSKLSFRSPLFLVAILVVALLVCTIATIVQPASACNTEDKNSGPRPWPWQQNGFGKWMIAFLNNNWGRFGGFFGDGWSDFPYRWGDTPYWSPIA